MFRVAPINKEELGGTFFVRFVPSAPTKSPTVGDSGTYYEHSISQAKDRQCNNHDQTLLPPSRFNITAEPTRDGVA